MVKFQTCFTVFSRKQSQTLNLLDKFHFNLLAFKIQYLDIFMIFYVNSRPFAYLLVQIQDLFQTLSHEKKNPDYFKVRNLKMKFQTLGTLNIQM